LHYDKKSDVAENRKDCKLQFIVTATAAVAKKKKRIEKLVECQENRSQEVATSSLSLASEPARLIPARFQVTSRLGFTKRERETETERQRDSVCRERDAECELVLKSSVRSKK
jgi:hypothetical protein